MKVKFIGESDPIALINDKIYEAIGIEQGCYRVIDEEGIDDDEELQGYLYPMDAFTVVEE
jgi:hypothetical protein